MKKRNRLLPIGILYTVLLIILVEIDMFTKRIAAIKLQDGPVVLIKNVLEFRYLENTGAAFSMLSNGRIFFLIITVLFLIFAVWFFIKIPVEKKYRLLRILILFIAAGAIGNFIDRLTLNYVRDFIYVSLINFPIFNVADIYITVSAITLIIFGLFTKEDYYSFLRKNNKAK